MAYGGFVIHLLVFMFVGNGLGDCDGGASRNKNLTLYKIT